MILLMDIGNTTVAIHEVNPETEEITCSYKLPTDIKEDYIRLITEVKSAFAISECLICSVVPAVTDLVYEAVKSIYGISAMILNRDDISMPISVDEPYKVGMDRLVDAFYAYASEKLPAVTVDLGTATTIGVITKEDGFIGGSISAGVGTSLQAISQKGAQLFSVALETPKSPIGKNTQACLQIGAVCGAAAMIDGMVTLIEKELKKEVTLFITGGYAGLLGEHLLHPHTVTEDLLVRGMLLLYKKRVNKN